MTEGAKVRVTEITFEVVVNGLRRVMTFKRPEKIADLLTADDVTLGAWLRDLVAMKPEGKMG